MEQFNIGDRVALLGTALSVPYIAKRANYTNMFVGKQGTVIAISVGANKKLGIEFDEKVFINHQVKQSSHDNGCNGKGKLHYCWYIPVDCVEKVPNPGNVEFPNYIEEAGTVSKEMQDFLDQENKKETHGSRNIQIITVNAPYEWAKLTKNANDAVNKGKTLHQLMFSGDTPYDKHLASLKLEEDYYITLITP